MGLKKLSLSGGDDYQYAFATHSCAKMLVAHLEGREGATALGSETDGPAGWDDMVLLHSDGSRVHYQIKKQESADTRPIERKEGADRSPIDKAMAALADLSRPPDFAGIRGGERCSFELLAPSDNLVLKKDLTLGHVRKFAKRCTKEGMVAGRLCEGEARDKTSCRVCAWLKSWCGFLDEEHILRGLRHLRMKSIGHQPDLEDETDEKLEPFFSAPKEVRKKLKAFLEDNADPAQATTPRLLWAHLRNDLRPNYLRWVQFRCEPGDGSWAVFGTTGIQTSRPEPPTEVVPALWVVGQGPRRLMVAAPLPGGAAREGLHVALARLAMHGEGVQTQVLIAGHATWRSEARRWLGGTLGLSMHHGEIGERWQELEGDGCDRSADGHVMPDLAAQFQEASALHDEMDGQAWTDLKREVQYSIPKFGALDLAVEMDKVWRRWCTSLEGDSGEASRLMASLLRAEAEPQAPEWLRLRIGPRTLPLLVDGILHLLAVAAALAPDQGTWEEVRPGRSTHAIALSRCADVKLLDGSAEDVHQQVEAIIAKERAQMLIVPAVQERGADVLMGDSDTAPHFLAYAKRPRLLVTGHRRFQRAAKKGLMELRQQLEGELEESEPYSIRFGQIPSEYGLVCAHDAAAWLVEREPNDGSKSCWTLLAPWSLSRAVAPGGRA